MVFQTDKKNKNYLRTNKTIIFCPQKRKKRKKNLQWDVGRMHSQQSGRSKYCHAEDRVF